MENPFKQQNFNRLENKLSQAETTSTASETVLDLKQQLSDLKNNPHLNKQEKLEQLEIILNKLKEQETNWKKLSPKEKEIYTKLDQKEKFAYLDLSPEGRNFYSDLKENKVERIKLKEQYDQQLKVLKETKLIEQLSNNTYGIIGIDQKEYTIPTFNQIIEGLAQKSEIYRTKIEQGFVKLMIVPFGKVLHDQENPNSLTQIYHNLLLEKNQKGELVHTNGEKVVLNTDNPFYIWKDEYQTSNENNIIYFPKKYNKNNHGGKSKKQLLQEDRFAFQVLLLEDNIDIPNNEQRKKTSGRQELEVGLKAEEYLKLLQSDPQYRQEQGLTTEAWLTLAITRLKQDNQIIDDFQGEGKICYNLATFFKKPSLGVSEGSFRRVSQRARLVRSDVSELDSACGVRPAVNIDLKA